MQLPVELNLQFLFEQRQVAHDVSSRAEVRDLSVPGFDTILTLSGRDDTWGAFLLAVAAMLREREDPWRVIEAFSLGDTTFAADYREEEWARSTIDHLVQSSAFILQASSREGVIDAATNTELLDDCMRRYDDRKAIIECIKRGSGRG
jgi:hypothetical protein